MKMTNRELETRYMHMKQTWKTLVEANVTLVDENKDLKEEIDRLNSKVEELMTLYTTEREVKEDYKSIIKEVREYISQLLEYKKEEYYKKISLNYVERILDILEGDLLDKAN